MLVLGDGGSEMRLVKIRPVDLTEVQLCIRDLPQQEVADPLLSAGADQQIGIGKTGRVQVAPHDGFVNRLGDDMATGQVPSQPAHRIDDLRAPAVVVGDVEHQVGIIMGHRDDLLHLLPQRRFQRVQIPAHPKLHAGLHQVFEFIDQRFPQQPHQRFHFIRWPPPVFRGKRIERQDADAILAARFDDPPHRLQASAVPGRPR